MATRHYLHLFTLLAERLHGRKAITAGTNTAAGLQFTVHAPSTNAHLDFKALIGQPALLKLDLADVRCSAQASMRWLPLTWDAYVLSRLLGATADEWCHRQIAAIVIP